MSSRLRSITTGLVARHGLSLIVFASASLCLLSLVSRAHDVRAQTTPVPPLGGQAGGLVPFTAGWHLIGGANLSAPDAVGPFYTWLPGDTMYEAVPNGTPLQRGVGYWVYFAHAASIHYTQGVTPRLPFTVPLAAGGFVLVGNPYVGPVSVEGADAVFIYDTERDTYELTTIVPPEQGAWAYSEAGGYATLTPLDQ